MGIMLLQIQLVIIRILSLAEMVGLPNIQIMQVIINVQILAAHTIQDRLVAILTRLPLINQGKEKAIILCSHTSLYLCGAAQPKELSGNCQNMDTSQHVVLTAITFIQHLLTTVLVVLLMVGYPKLIGLIEQAQSL